MPSGDTWPSCPARGRGRRTRARHHGHPQDMTLHHDGSSSSTPSCGQATRRSPTKPCSARASRGRQVPSVRRTRRYQAPHYGVTSLRRDPLPAVGVGPATGRSPGAPADTVIDFVRGLGSVDPTTEAPPQMSPMGRLRSLQKKKRRPGCWCFQQ